MEDPLKLWFYVWLLRKCILCFAFLSFFLVANNNLEQGSGMRENRIGRRFWKIFFFLIPPPNR
jgi:hypothetical protein